MDDRTLRMRLNAVIALTLANFVISVGVVFEFDPGALIASLIAAWPFLIAVAMVGVGLLRRD